MRSALTNWGWSAVWSSRNNSNALIEDMLRASPLGLRLTKEALGHAIDGQSLEAVIAMEDRNQTLCAHGEDFREAMTAFIEKRQPRYATTG